MDIPDSSGVTGGEMTDAEAFVAEYYWLRSFGMTDAAIARTLRVTEDQLVKRLQRAKVRREALSPDPDIDGRLRALIATGEPFDSWDFPLALEPYQVAAAISVAVRRGWSSGWASAGPALVAGACSKRLRPRRRWMRPASSTRGALSRWRGR